MNPKQLEPSPSIASALSLSNIKESMGHNVKRAQELQLELVQWRTSLHQELAEAQVLHGKEVLLASIIEEEMAHQTQVSVFSHYHLQQDKEVKTQSD